jgi:hypothetical protein
MKPLHPYVIRWLENPEKHRLLERLRKAEDAVGQFGTITITYAQGKIEKIIAESTEREKV